jgi:hypothetical protein
MGASTVRGLARLYLLLLASTVINFTLRIIANIINSNTMMLSMSLTMMRRDLFIFFADTIAIQLQ